MIFRILRSTAGVASCAALAASMALPGAADAAMRHGTRHMHMHHGHMHHMRMAKTPKLMPAHLKPTYHGMAGYPGGPAGRMPPMLVDMTPGRGMLAGLPLIGGLGL